MHAEDKANEEQEAFEERQFERETVEGKGREWGGGLSYHTNTLHLLSHSDDESDQMHMQKY
jgi:hypothetical protein